MLINQFFHLVLGNKYDNIEKLGMHLIVENEVTYLLCS